MEKINIMILHHCDSGKNKEGWIFCLSLLNSHNLEIEMFYEFGCRTFNSNAKSQPWLFANRSVKYFAEFFPKTLKNSWFPALVVVQLLGVGTDLRSSMTVTSFPISSKTTKHLVWQNLQKLHLDRILVTIVDTRAYF